MVRYIREEPGFQAYVDAVGRLPVLDRDQELALARRWRDRGDKAAADALVEGHLRSVVKIAHRFRGYGIYLSDLVAEGNLGLLEAVRRFDPERGLRFLTYARYWVRAYMLSHILKHWSIVDLGTTALQSKMFFRLQAEHARLTTELGAEEKEAITGRLAETFSTSEDQIRSSLQRLRRRDASLDVSVLPESNMTFLDLLEAQGQDQEERTAAAELSAMVQEAVADIWPGLDERERLILGRRLMRDADEAETLAELGRELGVTRERVRQIEAGLKRKIRSSFENISNPATRPPRRPERLPAAA